MNRRDVITAAAFFDSVAADAKARAADLRSQLEADARAEYLEQKTAPTWRSDVARVSASINQRRVVVENSAAFGQWVERNYPAAVVPLVVKDWQDRFLKGVEVEKDGTVSDPKTGQVVAGLALVAGGDLRGISVVVDADAKPVLASMAAMAVDRLALDSGLPGAVPVPAIEAAEVADVAA